MDKENTARFSDKADDYVKYRPNYPNKLLPLLIEKIHLTSNRIVADIGSGTGISAALFISNGNTVYGVEPNTKMRKIAENLYIKNDHFISIQGQGEQTHLKSHSVDIIFCGQAFHWLDKLQAKIEFNRILRNNGHIVLAWNIIDEQSLLGMKYQEILKQNIQGYSDLQELKIVKKEIENFFFPGLMNLDILENYQELNLRGLLGRLRSASLVPSQGAVYEKMVKEIGHLFTENETNKIIKLKYKTNVYWC